MRTARRAWNRVCFSNTITWLQELGYDSFQKQVLKKYDSWQHWGWDKSISCSAQHQVRLQSDWHCRVNRAYFRVWFTWEVLKKCSNGCFTCLQLNCNRTKKRSKDGRDWMRCIRDVYLFPELYPEWVSFAIYACNWEFNFSTSKKKRKTSWFTEKYETKQKIIIIIKKSGGRGKLLTRKKKSLFLCLRSFPLLVGMNHFSLQVLHFSGWEIWPLCEYRNLLFHTLLPAWILINQKNSKWQTNSRQLCYLRFISSWWPFKSARNQEETRKKMGGLSSCFAGNFHCSPDPFF